MTQEEIVQSKWQKVRGRVNSHWTRLTSEDVERLRKGKDELLPVLEKRYGYKRDYARREIRLWFDRQSTICQPDGDRC